MDHDMIARFSAPLRVSKAIHTIGGILKGMHADSTITQAEVHTLRTWLDEFADIVHKRPFSELSDQCEVAMADGRIGRDELDDLIWLADRLQHGDEYFATIRSPMQEIQAVLCAIAADETLTERELVFLRNWLAAHEELCAYWPCTEISAMLVAILKDGFVDDSEHRQLLSFVTQVIGTPTTSMEKSVRLSGVCAVGPDVQFADRSFCFTGDSKRATREEMQGIVIRRGGRIQGNVTRTLDYLVVGAAGSPFWSFSCYGRKVEHAVELRKKGLPLIIVHEVDFWDSATE